MTLDGHGINITTSVAGAVVVNVTSNSSTVRGMNITGSVSVGGSDKIHAQGVIYNLNISKNTIYSQGSTSDNIEVEGANYNVTIMGNRLTMPTSTLTYTISLNGLTTNALITQNSMNVSVGGASTVGVCISFSGSTSLHSNNTISYNNCTISAGGGTAATVIRLMGTGNGNIFDHNRINYTT